MDRCESAFAAVVDLEFVPRIGGKNTGDMPQAFSEGGSRKERVVALAEVMVIEVDREREHIDGESVGE